MSGTGVEEDDPQPQGETFRKVRTMPTYHPDYEVQVVQREERLVQSGELVEFAIMLQIRLPGDDDWIEVERVDCAHGAVHVDQTAGDGTVEKRHDLVPPECQADRDSALNWAIGYIWEVEERTVGWA